MTSQFRLMLATLACVIALAMGWLNSTLQDDTPPAGRRGGMATPQLAASEDIDRFVQAILTSNLFPNAQLPETTADRRSSSGPQTVEELEQSLQDPSLSAFVKRGDAWSIILYGVGEGNQTREVGSQLSDGWIIQTIDLTSVQLVKGDETRFIEAFKAEPDTE